MEGRADHARHYKAEDSRLGRCACVSHLLGSLTLAQPAAWNVQLPPFVWPMLLLLVIGVARNLYWPPPPPPLWVEVLVWAAISALVLYGSVFELRHPLGWDIDIWSVLMIVLIGVWGYSLLYPHGKLWRAFHPSEWGTGRENRRR